MREFKKFWILISLFFFFFGKFMGEKKCLEEKNLGVTNKLF